jgi:hypothetical protein
MTFTVIDDRDDNDYDDSIPEYSDTEAAAVQTTTAPIPLCGAKHPHAGCARFDGHDGAHRGYGFRISTALSWTDDEALTLWFDAETTWRQQVPIWLDAEATWWRDEVPPWLQAEDIWLEQLDDWLQAETIWLWLEAEAIWREQLAIWLDAETTWRDQQDEHGGEKGTQL